MDYGQRVLQGLRALSQTRDEDSPRAPIGLSEVGKCPRRLWYGAHGYSKAEETAPDTYMLFEMGHTAEASIIKGLRADGVIVIDRGPDGEQIGTELYGIPGHVDGIILEPTGPKDVRQLEDLLRDIGWGDVDLSKPIEGYRRLLLECKSVSEYGYKSLAAAGLENSYPDYLLQVQSYAVGLNLDGIVFLAVNKGGGGKDRKGITKPVIYTERLPVFPTLVHAHFSRIMPLLQQEEPPPRPYAKPEFQCSYCPFAQVCWQEEG